MVFLKISTLQDRCWEKLMRNDLKSIHAETLFMKESVEIWLGIINCRLLKRKNYQFV